MVNLFPVKAVVTADSVVEECSGEKAASTSSAAPNRFSQQYDRSVFGGEECLKLSGGSQCKCNLCCSTPLVLVTAGGESAICNDHNINLRNVQEFIDGGVLHTLHDESLMIYCQAKPDGDMQVGIFAAVDVEDCLNNAVRRHENVTSEEDVTLCNEQKPQKFTYVDPVMLMYREDSNISTIIHRIITTQRPLNIPHLAVDGHYLWVLRDPLDVQAIQAAFGGIESLYIADGHHRTKAACEASLKRSRLAQQQQANGKVVVESNRYLTALIYPDTHLNTISYNRCVRYLDATLDTETLLGKISKAFTLEKMSDVPTSSTPALPCTEPLPAAPVRRRSQSSPPPNMVSTLLSNYASSMEEKKKVGMKSKKAPAETVANSPPPPPPPPPAAAAAAAAVVAPGVLAAPRPRAHPTNLPADVVVKEVEEVDEDDESNDGSDISMYLHDKWYRLRPRNVSNPEEVAVNPLITIDSQILLDHLLDPILAVNDPKNDNYMVYVDGREGYQGVQRVVDSGEAALGFVVGAVSTKQIMAVADASKLLPPKATFFDPKPMPKLLLRLLR